MNIQTVSLKDYCSLRIGGEGQMVTVKTTSELIEVCMYAKKESKRLSFLGGGTNTYFGESSNYLLVKVDIKGRSFEDQEEYALLTAYAGEVWDDIVLFSTDKKLWGIENLSYIPGTVGAAPVQNIGAYGAELKDVFVSLQALDTETFDVVEINNEACDFGYRDSLFKKNPGKYIIISVTLRLSKNSNPRLTYKPLDMLVGKKDLTSEDVRKVVIDTRKAKLPDWVLHPNAGSFFKNPIVSLNKSLQLKNLLPEVPLILVEEGFKIPAAWLIENVAEMKGVRLGDVGTWPTQPLALVNYGNTTANELDAFAEIITKKIKDKTGIELVREVNRVG